MRALTLSTLFIAASFAFFSSCMDLTLIKADRPERIVNSAQSSLLSPVSTATLGTNKKSEEELAISKYMTLLLQFLCADSLQADHIQTILDRREDAKKLSAAAYFATGLFLIGRELIKRGLDIQSEQPNVAELCARLVRLGANVNPTLNNKLESTSRPPIVWVALRGRTALCQALIDAGAQFSAGETSISNDRILTPLSPDVYITCDPLEKRFTVATEALR